MQKAASGAKARFRAEHGTVAAHFQMTERYTVTVVNSMNIEYASLQLCATSSAVLGSIGDVGILDILFLLTPSTVRKYEVLS